MKDFALTPDNGPPRILRFVDDGVLQDGAICVLDDKTNVLSINRTLYDKLDSLQQNRVQRTHAAMIVWEFPRAA